MTKFKSLDYRIKDVDSPKGIVEFYASSFGSRPEDKDSDGDVIMAGAFKKTVNENKSRIRHLLNHWESVGVPVEMKEDDFGLNVRSQLIMGKQLGRELFEEYKVYADLGNSMEHSIGFIPLKQEEDKENEVNYIKEVKLMDVTTMTTWGANPNTPQGALKQYGTIEDTLRVLEKLIKADFSDEKLEKIESIYKELKALIQQPSKDTAEEPPGGGEPSEDTHWKYLIENSKLN